MSAAVLRQAPLPDPIRAGIASGWKVIDASALSADLALEADVAIVGTGAGGGTAAEILSAAGLSRRHGRGRAACDLVATSACAKPRPIRSSTRSPPRARPATRRSTSCRDAASAAARRSTGHRAFRTPPTTLDVLARTFGIAGFRRGRSGAVVRAHGSRLTIAPWDVPPNENNDVAAPAARQGSASRSATIRRNVKGCWNIGYCGMGCPTNAKQSMLVTTIPAALDARRDAASRARARGRSIIGAASASTALDCVGAGRARHRSDRAPHRRRAPRPSSLPAARSARRRCCCAAARPTRTAIVGKRTFLHPTVVSAALMPRASRRLRGRAADRLLRPFPRCAARRRPDRLQARGAAAASGAGRHHAARRRRAHTRAGCASFRQCRSLIALLRDGFHPESPGGTVSLQGDGTPSLDYPLNDYSGTAHGARSRRWPRSSSPRARRRSCRFMPRARAYANWSRGAARRSRRLPLQPLATAVVSAHVMGGCPLGPDPSRAVYGPRRPSSSSRQPLRTRRLAVPDQRSAPIHSFRSTGLWPSSRPRWHSVSPRAGRHSAIRVIALTPSAKVDGCSATSFDALNPDQGAHHVQASPFNPQPSQRQRAGESALFASRQAWLAGLGAASISREWARHEAGNTFRALVQRGLGRRDKRDSSHRRPRRILGCDSRTSLWTRRTRNRARHGQPRWLKPPPRRCRRVRIAGVRSKRRRAPSRAKHAKTPHDQEHAPLGRSARQAHRQEGRSVA